MQARETPTAAADGTDQHSAIVSVLLHIVPGLVILGAIFAFSHPALMNGLGIAPELGPAYGLTAANLLVTVMRFVAMRWWVFRATLDR